ncbi:SSU ribosomal protein S30P/sigma 54 modulation protein [Geoalkalibacter ferrihydriticus]|uniref:Ribosome hibernation promoting factor n=2 Tax=Geoalkalibacter ferrihydriticus TaxID=392333 RepID=A0A0C2EDA6_9BACT|nr:ribosome-associated translation inhibitor RaiA [Geoalkalibacter ferrihydriticus]KIH76573.1 pseudouridine synthase [Geoalkalibacter ferrihydriticus DSM 17813]SDM02036.1 SSU ribosomal protein S30P/sigma 54 modulation protein [Geoalkalibacter ferrihydriticus]
MQIAVTFRHMEASDPLRGYVEEKLERVKKYIDEPVEAQVVLSVEKKIRHRAEVALTAKGITIKGSDETNDMYAAVDGMVDKVERQLKRYKEKIKNHKPSSGRERTVQKTVFAAESIDEGQGAPSIIRSHSFPVKPMSVEEAVMQMDLLQKEFLVFTDDESEAINVVYRRRDGNYGLIIPQTS